MTSSGDQTPITFSKNNPVLEFNRLKMKEKKKTSNLSVDKRFAKKLDK